jgi:hypothetical protein
MGNCDRMEESCWGVMTEESVRNSSSCLKSVHVRCWSLLENSNRRGSDCFDCA